MGQRSFTHPAAAFHINILIQNMIQKETCQFLKASAYTVFPADRYDKSKPENCFCISAIAETVFFIKYTLL